MKGIITTVLAFTLLLALLVLTSSAEAFEHNITAISTTPGNGVRTPINIPTPIACEYRNNGDSAETNVKAYFIIKKNTGEIIYKDSTVISDWLPQYSKDATFRDFTPTATTNYQLISFCVLSVDENTSDDTVYSTAIVGYEADAIANGVIEPYEDEIKTEGTSFKLIGSFKNTSARDLYDVPVRVRILRCGENQLVFQSDTILSELLTYMPPVQTPFPKKQGIYETSKLVSGCYKIAVICRQSDDGDRTNDTSYSTFSIVTKRFDNDISVNSILPSNNSVLPPTKAVPISGVFQNKGLQNETSVKLIAEIIGNTDGKTIYTDTSIQYQWTNGYTRNISFLDFYPPKSQQYTLRLSCQSNNDQVSNNNSLVSIFQTGNSCEVTAVSVIKPEAGTIFADGEGFIPEVAFRWDGDPTMKTDVPIRMQIRRCSDNSLIFRIDTVIPQSSFNFGNVYFVFSPLGSEGGIKDLPEGCYTISYTSLLSCDADKSNDVVQVSFRVGSIANDLSTTAIISPPLKHRMMRNSTVPVISRFKNTGLYEQSIYKVLAYIVDPNGLTVYQHILPYSSLAAGKTIEVKFKDFIPVSYGVYKCFAVSILSADGWKGNDTLSQNFTVTKENDVAAVIVTYPKPNAIIPKGTLFQPSGSFQARWGLYDIKDIPVKCQISDCNNDSVIYTADHLIAELKQEDEPVNIIFYPEVNTRYLANGCYKLRIIALYNGDIDAQNDTAYISFSVFAHTLVENNSSSLESITLYQNYPNPLTSNTTISYSLPERGRTSLRVMDVTGRVVKIHSENESQEAGEHQIKLNMQDLLNGVYIYELDFINEKGEEQRVSRRMTILNKSDH